MIFGDFFKNLFKYFFLAILCLVPVVILGAGVYCGVDLYKQKKSVSQTYGELNEHDLYEDFNVFDCDLSSAIFYQTITGYEYTTTIPKAVEFNGSTSKYNVLVNDQPSTNEQSSAGILTAKNTINYYGIDGNEINQTVLTIEFKFYQSKVEISIKNTNTAEQQALFLEYIAFNGLKIRTIEAQYVPTVSTSEYYTITFLGKDGELVSASKVTKGSKITVPEAPKYDGYIFSAWSPTVPTYATQNATFTAIYEPESENLLSAPLVYDLQKPTYHASEYSVSIGEHYSEFCDFPYELEVQVCYFENKASDEYEVLETCTLQTDKKQIFNEITYENSQTYYDFIINSNEVSFRFWGIPSSYTSNGVVVLRDYMAYAQVTIDAYQSDSPNANYLYEHIKIMITSIKTISG